MIAARVRAIHDVVEAHQALTKQPGVEPAERGLALRKLVIIQQRDHAGHSLYIGDQQWAPEMDEAERTEHGKTHGRRAARTPVDPGFTLENILEVVHLRGDVGKAATRSAVQITKVRNKSDWTTAAKPTCKAMKLVSEVPKKKAHSDVLVFRALEVVREAARGEGRRDFRAVVNRAADASDPGTY